MEMFDFNSMPDGLKRLLGVEGKGEFKDVRELTQEERTRFLQLKLSGETAHKAKKENEALGTRFWAEIDLSTKLYDSNLKIDPRGNGKFMLQVKEQEEEN